MRTIDDGWMVGLGDPVEVFFNLGDSMVLRFYDSMGN